MRGPGGVEEVENPRRGAVRLPSSVSATTSELEQLRVRRGDAHLLGAERNDHRRIALDGGDSSETVGVVADPISHGKRLDGFRVGLDIEGAC
jgi:hypothetical protein